MPIGELAVLASTLVFSITGIVQKRLVTRFRPLTLGALGAGGGSLAALIFVLTTSDITAIPHIPPTHIVLGVLGGIINIGLGEPLYLLFLRNVDISKAWPIMAGLLSTFSLLSGILILRETPTAFDIGGVIIVVTGVYLLSFGQRKHTDKNQASWLGIKGIFLLSVVSAFWVSGLTVQGYALREMDPPTLNLLRLSAVCIFLTIMSWFGISEILIPSEEDASLGFGSRVKKALSQGLMARVAARSLGLGRSGPGDVAHRDSLRRRRVHHSGWSFRRSGVAVANGAGMLGVASMLFLVGIERAGLSISAVLGSTQIFWTTMLSVLVLRERMNVAGIVGITAMFSGITIILLF